MVESALEFARIARSLGYHDFVFSMKSSNPKVMVEAYRLLAARLDEENRIAAARRAEPGTPISHETLESWNYPLHLGVTEAGDGEDGRIKSAIGIGSLLHDGIGDTIRVSLTEDSVHEIPVARALVEAAGRAGLFMDADPLSDDAGAYDGRFVPPFDPFSYDRRASETIERGDVKMGGEELVRVVIREATFEKIAHKLARLGDYQPEIIYEQAEVHAVDPRDGLAIGKLNAAPEPQLVTVQDGTPLPVIAAFRLLAARLAVRHPILLKDTLELGNPKFRSRVGDEEIGSDQLSAAAQRPVDFLSALLTAATNLGSLLCDGIGDAILVQGEDAPGQSLRLAYNTLQAAGTRVFKTDYVACPSCGRTLFNLQTTTARIKAATAHLKGVKIAVMGCIVNGPGEMADADFGYVGGAPGKVNLYVGKQPVKFNIPEDEAVDRLKDLIREHGKWIEPAGAIAVSVP
jgi:(E)-4-hydroxy-3-methylbut-2-enyl-diphosphate synthase